MRKNINERNDLFTWQGENIVSWPSLFFWIPFCPLKIILVNFFIAMKSTNSLLFWYLFYSSQVATAFVPQSVRPSAIATRQAQHQKAEQVLHAQRNASEILSVENPTLPKDEEPSSKTTPKREAKELDTTEPAPRFHRKAKRGEKILVKDKNSAQFYEVKKIGLDPSRSHGYDTIDLKPNAEENDISFALDTLFTRTLDTVEDAILHARRIPYDLGWFLADSQVDDQRKTIVVLGTYSHCKSRYRACVCFL
jgi:hypothetical protein